MNRKRKRRESKTGKTEKKEENKKKELICQCEVRESGRKYRNMLTRH
jgi:hypothetical protein